MSRRKKRWDELGGERKHMSNLQMDPEVYKLRRTVIDLIYEARELAPLPRITVRITEDDTFRHRMGVAGMNANIIRIPKSSTKISKKDLRAIVYHEILHAILGVPHDNKCKLMSPYFEPLTKKEAQTLFKKWIKKLK